MLDIQTMMYTERQNTADAFEIHCCQFFKSPLVGCVNLRDIDSTSKDQSEINWRLPRASHQCVQHKKREFALLFSELKTFVNFSIRKWSKKESISKDGPVNVVVNVVMTSKEFAKTEVCLKK